MKAVVELDIVLEVEISVAEKLAANKLNGGFDDPAVDDSAEVL